MKNAENDYGLIRQISFRAWFLAKLNLIVWAAGTKRKAAQQLGVTETTLYAWYADDNHCLHRRALKALDERYLIAFERKLLHERKLEAKRSANKGDRSELTHEEGML